MKVPLLALLSLALNAGVFAAEPRRVEGITPLPRVRLAVTPQGAVAQVEKSAPAEAGARVVVMDKIVVNGEKLTAPSNTQPPEPEPKKFSLLRGGPMIEGTAGAFTTAVGLWSWTEIFPEDAKFRPQKTRADLDIVRIKW